MEEVLDVKPLLLLDDVMSELDGARREALVAFIAEDVQTIVTTANLAYFGCGYARSRRYRRAFSVLRRLLMRHMVQKFTLTHLETTKTAKPYLKTAYISQCKARWVIIFVRDVIIKRYVPPGALFVFRGRGSVSGNRKLKPLQRG